MRLQTNKTFESIDSRNVFNQKSDRSTIIRVELLNVCRSTKPEPNRKNVCGK